MEDKYKKYGLIGTILFHAIIVLLLIFFGLSMIPQEEEGLLVNFGDTETGQGLEEPKESQAEQAIKVTPPPPVKAPPVKTAASKEAINTQDFEEAAALKEEKKKKIEADKIVKKKIEVEKQKQLAAEKVKKEAEEAEKQKQEELARQAAEARNKVKNAFGGKGTGSSTSEGETGGSGNQGYVTGDPNSKNRTGSGQGTKGSGYSLSGRSLSGSLPQPEYGIQEEGIVVIEITVDKEGRVTNATPVLRGTTTQNSYLWKVAREAAMKARFNSDSNAPSFQKGTITYHFVLN